MPAVAPADPSEANSSLQLGPSDLQRIEQALLAAILDVRPNNANAIDELLDDPKFTGDRAEVERFLTAAVLDTHSARSGGLDPMPCDEVPVAPFAAHA